MGRNQESRQHPEARVPFRRGGRNVPWCSLIQPDTREDYGEERWIGIGLIQGRIALVAFAERPPLTVRIISLRKADHEEREQYEKALEDGLEAD
jgi:Ribonuclease toxin, BrnT, of type II toxin-antitoxin system